MAWVPAAAALMPHRTRAVNAQSSKIISKILKMRFMVLFCPMKERLFRQRFEDLGGGVGDDGGGTAGH